MCARQIASMDNSQKSLSQKSLRRPLRVKRPAPKVQGARSRTASAAASHAHRRDFHRGMIVVASLAALLGGLFAGGYGVHSQIAATNERTARYYWQVATTARAELREGAVLFVPIGGNVCRRRWIDNATWTIRDGGDIECNAAVSWNATVPEPQYHVGLRLDAVRNTFRAKAGGNPVNESPAARNLE